MQNTIFNKGIIYSLKWYSDRVADILEACEASDPGSSPVGTTGFTLDKPLCTGAHRISIPMIHPAAQLK